MNTAVGSRQGQVHSERQGTGLGTVLQGDAAVDAYGRIALQDGQRRAAADAAAKAKREGALAKLTAFAPDYFYLHKEQMQPLLQGHIEKGATMVASGLDPFTGGSPEAIEWQKEHQRIAALAENSKQIKAEYIAFRQDLEGKDPSEFTAESMKASEDWFTADLLGTLERGQKRPPLLKKKAWEDAFTFVGKNMRTWQTDNADPSDAEILDFTTALITDPANQKVVESYAQKLSTTPPEERTRLEKAAKAADREVVQQMAFEDAKRWQKAQAPFDYMKEFSEGVKLADGSVDYAESDVMGVGYRGPKKGSVEKSAALAAEAMLNNRPEWMTIFDENGELPRGEEEETGSYYARVKAHLAGKLKEGMGVNTKYSKDKDKGKGDMYITTRDQFIADMRSGDSITADSASKILLGTGFANNLKVERAVVNTAPDRRQFLRLELATPMSLKDVKSMVVNADTGIEEESVTLEQRSGKSIAIINLGKGDIANQTLGRLYDNYHKETGAYYDPALTERGIKTAAGIVPSMPKQATPTTKKVGSVGDIFK